MDSIFYIETVTVTVFDHPPTTFAAARRARAPRRFTRRLFFFAVFSRLSRAPALSAPLRLPPANAFHERAHRRLRLRHLAFRLHDEIRPLAFLLVRHLSREDAFELLRGHARPRERSRALLVGVAGARHHHGVDGVFVALLVQERDVYDDKWVRVSLRGVEECPSRVVDKGMHGGFERAHVGFVLGAEDERAEGGTRDATVLGDDGGAEERAHGFDGRAAGGVQVVNDGVAVEDGNTHLREHARDEGLAHGDGPRQAQKDHGGRLAGSRGRRRAGSVGARGVR